MTTTKSYNFNLLNSEKEAIAAAMDIVRKSKAAMKDTAFQADAEKCLTWLSILFNEQTIVDNRQTSNDR